MIFNLFRKPTAPDAVFEAYRSIVAQSRQETFYADWGVPDTVTGRFDMISLHLALLLHRLRGEPAARPFAQALVDLFFRDMDRSLRELGVTDLGVPKKIKKMGNVFYGLVEAVSDALDSGSTDTLVDVLKRNLYGEVDAGASALAAYTRNEAARLAARPTQEIVSATGVAA
jgi:cytochrome b pre-mRNA-processing protein 3